MRAGSIRLYSTRMAVVTFLFAMIPAAEASAAELKLRIVDEQGKTLPCRVLIRPRGAECILPDRAVFVPLPPDRWFISTGETSVEAPRGKTLLRVERGLEYVRYKEEFEITDAVTTKTITLQRWIDMRSRGYLCGENHIHVAPARLGPMLLAEGLDFGTSLTWWNGPDEKRPIPPDSKPVSLLKFAGREVPASVFDAELEYGWGAAYIQNLPEPMPIQSDRKRPNLDYLRHACRAGGLVSYQAGWSREVLLDALLGHVHVINVCNNNFHLHRFQPRSNYSNLLEVPGFPVYPDTDRGMMRMNMETYYRLLNCGLRLASGAGTACGVKPNPVGYNRAYVRVPDGASLEQFNNAWAAGRNFVTNGPMIFLETARGQMPGDTIELPAGRHRVSVRLTILSDQPLTSAEIVLNGRVAHAFALESKREFRGVVSLDVSAGAWLAARCTAEDDLLDDEELSVYRWGSDEQRFRQRPSRLRFAHTSPIYFLVDGQGAAVPESIRQGLAMLDRFERHLRRQADEQHIDATVQAIQSARAKLRLSVDPASPGVSRAQ